MLIDQLREHGHEAFLAMHRWARLGEHSLPHQARTMVSNMPWSHKEDDTRHVDNGGSERRTLPIEALC